MTGGKIKLSSDDRNAQIYLGDTNCYKNIKNGNLLLKTMYISEAKSQNENVSSPETTEDQNTGEFPLIVVIGCGVGAGAVVLLVLVCVCWRTDCGCCGQRNSGAIPGHYRRASIDSNFQYGEGKEY